LLLAEACARMGQIDAELTRRAGQAFALLISQREPCLLRYRASVVVAPLLYSWGCGMVASVV